MKCSAVEHISIFLLIYQHHSFQVIAELSKNKKKLFVSGVKKQCTTS
jgi:hypothetical protein